MELACGHRLESANLTKRKFSDYHPGRSIQHFPLDSAPVALCTSKWRSPGSPLWPRLPHACVRQCSSLTVFEYTNRTTLEHHSTCELHYYSTPVPQHQSAAALRCYSTPILPNCSTTALQYYSSRELHHYSSKVLKYQRAATWQHSSTQIVGSCNTTALLQSSSG